MAQKRVFRHILLTFQSRARSLPRAGLANLGRRPPRRRPTAKCRGTRFYKGRLPPPLQPRKPRNPAFAGHGKRKRIHSRPLGILHSRNCRGTRFPESRHSALDLAVPSRTSIPQVPRAPLSPLQAPLRGNFAVGRRLGSRRRPMLATPPKDCRYSALCLLLRLLF